MQELPSQERREYVRAPLFVDVEFAVVHGDEYEAVRRSEQQRPSCRFVSQAALSFDEGGQYETDSAFHSNLINFLIHIDDKLDRMLKLLSKVSGLEVSACNDDKGDEDLFVGRGANISGAGMSVVCDKALEPGQILKASFIISRFPVIPLVLFGQVVRIIPVQGDDKQRYQVVLRFIDLDEEDREKIIAYTFQAQRDAIRKEKKGKNSNNG
jgi:c-di-GMP-binding flagellar brake protein YcgR